MVGPIALSLEIFQIVQYLRGVFAEVEFLKEKTEIGSN
jgi:hypothetical protein